MARITWTPIDHAHLHGMEATVGNRKAEVVRCSAGQWASFHYMDGHMVRRDAPQPPLSKQDAQRNAVNFLTARA